MSNILLTIYIIGVVITVYLQLDRFEERLDFIKDSARKLNMEVNTDSIPFRIVMSIWILISALFFPIILLIALFGTKDNGRYS